MIAGYHHKLPPDLQQDLNKARQQAEQWASGEYAQALAKGDSLTPEERQKTAEQMARFTGLSKEVIDEANLRIDVPKFTHYLLIDQKLRVGRLDGRYTGPDPNGLLDTPFYDPTESNILAPFNAAFNNYLRNELGYKVDMPYFLFAREQGFEEKWDWGSGIEGFPDTASALAAGHGAQSIPEGAGDGGLLRSGYSLLCGELHVRSHGLAGEISRTDFVSPLMTPGTWFICRWRVSRR